MGKPRAERGFTLLELMVTVAIIAILAIVVVPYFFGESRKAKAKTEVAVMFAELGQKEEAFKIDSPNGQYLDTGAPWPAAPQQTSQNLLPIPLLWTQLRVVIPQNQVYCTYRAFANIAGTPPTTTLTTGPFNMPICTPNCPTAWFTLFAQCDMDGKPGFSEYFTNSTDSSIQVHNEGS